MGSKTTLGFKLGQWIVRGLQICCALVILSLTCYFIGSQANRELDIWTWERAVAGITGAALGWFLIQALVLCCIAGVPITSGLAILVDGIFIGAFLYVAWAYRLGAGTCKGDDILTPYGVGKDFWKIAEHVEGDDGWTRLPTYAGACNMTRACLAVAILTIIFLIFSILFEFRIIKNRKADKAAAAAAAVPLTAQGKGLFGFRRKTTRADTNNILRQNSDQTRDVEKADA